MWRSAVLTVIVLLWARVVHAQGADSAARTAEDSVLVRARQLAHDGRDADGRRLIDSLLAVLTPDSARYGEALYARGTLASTAADAERDYRRLLIEVPLAARAEDALLQLAQLEQARGDRRGASDHLQRYLLSYPQGAARARVSVQLVRLLFDQGPQQLARACDALRTAKEDVPASNVELRNQLEAQEPRCAYVDVQPAAPAPDSAAAAVAATTAAADTTRAAPPAANPSAAPAPTPTKPGVTPNPPPAAPPVTAATKAGAPAQSPAPAPAAPAAAVAPPVAPAAFYSVQVAAYESQEAATRMVQQLVARGIDARVDGAKPPYRVRVGKFQTRADAARAAADLKGKGHNGFITLVNPGPK